MIRGSWLVALLLCACSVRAEPPAQQRAVKATSPEPTAPGSPAASEPQPRASSATEPQVLLTSARKSIIDAFVARDTLRLTPDAATARFARVYALKRERESIDGFVLIGESPGEVLEFDFSPNGKGGFNCGVASLRFEVAPSQSASLEQAVEEHLRAKLGKPKIYPNGRKSRHWKIARRTEVTLFEHAAPAARVGERVVELRTSETGGP